jgi:hypothetical protein
MPPMGGPIFQSRILVLMNMVTPNELKDDQEYEGMGAPLTGSALALAACFTDRPPAQISWTMCGRNAASLA